METNMTENTIQNDWSDLKTKIKAKWDKFSEKEIDGFKDSLDTLSVKIQTVYGCAKEQAEREYTEFKRSITSK